MDPSTCRHHQCMSMPLDSTSALAQQPMTTNAFNYSCSECARVKRALMVPQVCLCCGKCQCSLHAEEGHNAQHQRSAGGSHPFVGMDVISGKTMCFECGGANELARGATAARMLDAFRTRSAHKRGLANLGNTCYLNATLQALHHTGSIESPPLARTSSTTVLPPTTRSRALGAGGLNNNGDAGGLIVITPLASSSPTPVASASAPLSQVPQGSPLFHSYQALFAREVGGVNPDPSPFVNLVKSKMPVFATMLQQDAHEFLRIFTDHLQKEQVWISDPFKGAIVSETTCRQCGKVQSKLDPCLDLSLEFPDTTNRVIRFTNDVEGGPIVHARVLRLADCLKRFFSLEQHVSKEVCSSCVASSPNASARKAASQVNGAASSSTIPLPGFSKRLKFHSLPNVLVIHLKRFKWTWDSCEKIQTFVQFPLRDLTLDEFKVSSSGISGPMTRASSSSSSGSTATAVASSSSAVAGDAGIKYDLISVVCHHGRSFLHGHYTSYCLDRDDNTWYHFNDDIVAPVDEEVVTRCEAYLLFYQQRRS